MSWVLEVCWLLPLVPLPLLAMQLQQVDYIAPSHGLVFPSLPKNRAPSMLSPPLLRKQAQHTYLHLPDRALRNTDILHAPCPWGGSSSTSGSSSGHLRGWDGSSGRWYRLEREVINTIVVLSHHHSRRVSCGCVCCCQWGLGSTTQASREGLVYDDMVVVLH